jgi:competence protein ComGD
MRLNNSKGYTITEVLVVLSIFLLLVTLSLNLYPKYIEKMETKQFVKQFEQDLYYTQAYAISHERQISMYINKRNYSIYSIAEGYVLQRTIPEQITFKKVTMDLSITFNSAGTALSSGVIYIQTEQEKYKITVYVGKGRIKIEKV